MRSFYFCAIAALVSSCGPSASKEGTETQSSVTTTQILPVDSQVVFSLSMVSNIPAAAYSTHYYDSTSSSLQIIDYTAPKMDATLTNATDNTGGQNLTLKDWERVWGPAVAVKRSAMVSLRYVSDASLTIYRSKTTGDYVLGIQATNPYSLFDWDVLDFDVSKTVPWTDFCPSASNSGVLSIGTSKGLDILRNLHCPLTPTQPTAVDFLDSVIATNKPVNIVVTGHSLGGALSPVFALYMQNEVGKLNAGATAKIYCMPTAGATPGDATFAAYYDSKLGSNTMKVRNHYDVVPRGWDSLLMQEIITSPELPGGLYSGPGSSVAFDSIYVSFCSKSPKHKSTIPFQPISTPAGIVSLIKGAMQKAKNSGVTYTHICNGGTSFPGPQLNGAIYVNIDTNDDKTIINKIVGSMVKLGKNDFRFADQLGAQHVAAYYIHYNMRDIHEYMKSLIAADSISMVNISCHPFIGNAESVPAPALTEEQALWQLMYMKAWKW